MDHDQTVKDLFAVHEKLYAKVDFNAPPDHTLLEDVNEFMHQLRLAGRVIQDESTRRKLNNCLKLWSGYRYHDGRTGCPFAEILPLMPDKASLQQSDEGTVLRGQKAQQTPLSIETIKGVVHTGSGDINVRYVLQFVLPVLDDIRVPLPIANRIRAEADAIARMPLDAASSQLSMRLSNLVHFRVIGCIDPDAMKSGLEDLGFADSQINAFEEAVSDFAFGRRSNTLSGVADESTSGPNDLVH